MANETNDSENCYGTGANLVLCILTYNNHQIDIYLNYMAILLAIIPLVLTFTFLNHNKYASVIRHTAWIIILLGLFLFQIGLCVAVSCAGVSVVWSALVGFTPFLFVNIKYFDATAYENLYVNFINATLYVSTVYSIALWIYYAMVATFITTVAHFCALVLGIFMAYIIIRLFIFFQPDRTYPVNENIQGSNADYVLLK